MEIVLGLTIQGPMTVPIKVSSSLTVITLNIISLITDANVTRKQIWEVEPKDIKGSSPGKSQDGVTLSNGTVTLQKGRYQVRMPRNPYISFEDSKADDIESFEQLARRQRR